MIRLPGLVDPHVHFRDPGATHKEDFASGTAAAVAGGFTAVLAMPNTEPPIIDSSSLERAKLEARKKCRCDYGIYLGATRDNVSFAQTLARNVCGLKLYVDQTFGPLQLSDPDLLQLHMSRWPRESTIVAHAEGESLDLVLGIADELQRSIHIAHVSREAEISRIRDAKQRGVKVTCEVTPHHLFLSEQDIDRLGTMRATVRPPLATAADREALWQHMDVIDCFATDHAPHLASEKDQSPSPPGFPGLETVLGLLMTAVHEDRLTLDGLIRRMYENPLRIFRLPVQTDTFVELDETVTWEPDADQMYSRCGWTPYAGMKLRGRIQRVVLRGREILTDGEIVAQEGTGKELDLA